MMMYLSMIETLADRDKFEQIYLKYRKLMFHVANKILKNPHDSEDAVQQAFVSINKNLEMFSEIECHKTRSTCVKIPERSLGRTQKRIRIGALLDKTAKQYGRCVISLRKRTGHFLFICLVIPHMGLPVFISCPIIGKTDTGNVLAVQYGEVCFLGDLTQLPIMVE